MTTVRLPVGGGRGKNYNSFHEECDKRRGIISIKNTDNLCLPRALVVAIAHNKRDPEFSKVRRDISKIQTERTRSLLERAKISIPEAGGGIPELIQFQNHLKEYKLVVYSYGSKGRNIIFEGSTESNKRLNLLHYKSHFNVITSLTAAFCSNYFCEKCYVPYDHKNEHRCGGSCQACQQASACEIAIKIKCQDCLRFFRSQNCYENHKKDYSSGKFTVCEQIKLCSICLKTIKAKRAHACGEIYCKICNKHASEDHLCYIRPDKGKPKIKDVLFVFYDLETSQDKLLENSTFLHQVNLCVFKQYCDECMDSEADTCKKMWSKVTKSQRYRPSGNIY